jgi:hypothetical protein
MAIFTGNIANFQECWIFSRNWKILHTSKIFQRWRVIFALGVHNSQAQCNFYNQYSFMPHVQLWKWPGKINIARLSDVECEHSDCMQMQNLQIFMLTWKIKMQALLKRAHAFPNHRCLFARNYSYLYKF